MAIIVVGGSGKGVGKTTLICGLIAALPEFAWTAIKISSHEHGRSEPIWEESTPGQGTDTARYLAAGARRAVLVTAGEDDLPLTLSDLRAKPGWGFEADAHVIFESNRILLHPKPDVCLAVGADAKIEGKRSSSLLAHHMDAEVALADDDHVYPGEKPLFQLAALDRISPEMQEWLRQHLAHL